MTLSIAERSRIKAKYGPWAVITGASSGIGKELATRLAEADLNVVLVARRKELLTQLATDVEAAYDIETRIVVADLSRPDQMQEVLNATADLDVGLLIAAAGFGTSGSFLEANLEEELSMLRVNCEALFRQTYHFALRFANRGNGGIILLSSMVGFQGVPYAAHYAATKAYVQSLGEALSVELKPLGVDVLAAAPGPVESGFGERADMQMNMALRPADIGVSILKALGRKSTVLPGWLTKLLVGALRTVPRWGKVRIMKQVMGGMTAHQKGN